MTAYGAAFKTEGIGSAVPPCLPRAGGAGGGGAGGSWAQRPCTSAWQSTHLKCERVFHLAGRPLTQQPFALLARKPGMTGARRTLGRVLPRGRARALKTRTLLPYMLQLLAA